MEAEYDEYRCEKALMEILQKASKVGTEDSYSKVTKNRSKILANFRNHKIRQVARYSVKIIDNIELKDL
jgi:hypothetical protein